MSTKTPNTKIAPLMDPPRLSVTTVGGPAPLFFLQGVTGPALFALLLAISLIPLNVTCTTFATTQQPMIHLGKQNL